MGKMDKVEIKCLEIFKGLFFFNIHIHKGLTLCNAKPCKPCAWYVHFKNGKCIGYNPT